MRRDLRAFLMTSILALSANGLWGQSSVYLQGLYIGSDGTASREAQGAEETLGELHDKFLQAMGLRSRGSMVVALSSLTGQSAYDRIAPLQASSDSNDVAVVVALGGWEKDVAQVEFSSLSSAHRDRLTLDYLLNLMLFLPVKTMAVFVVAPPPQPFPLDMFKAQKPGIGGGGKYLVVLQPKNKEDFDGAVDAFHDLVEKSGEGEGGDRNKDGALSFTEWMILLGRLGGTDFTVLPYRITEGPDIQLRQLH